MNERYKELSKEQTRQVCRNLGQLVDELDISHEELAERTTYRRSTITQLLQGRFAPHLDIVFCLLAAVNELKVASYSLKDIDAPPIE